MKRTSKRNQIKNLLELNKCLSKFGAELCNLLLLREKAETVRDYIAITLFTKWKEELEKLTEYMESEPKLIKVIINNKDWKLRSKYEKPE